VTIENDDVGREANDVDFGSWECATLRYVSDAEDYVQDLVAGA
jgi:hypothetical protein